MPDTPFLIVSDGPQEPTGLGRISRDLGALLHDAGLPVDLVSVGGIVPPIWRPWRHVPMSETDRGDDWGRSYIEAVWKDLWGSRPGILWLIWDPGRLAHYIGAQVPASLWNYPAIDGSNRSGTLSGPAAGALAQADRVIAYGRWASQIIQEIRGEPVPYLPHGLSLQTYSDPATPAEIDWVRSLLGPHVRSNDRLIGCVTTNQPRKDLGLYFGTLAELRARGHQVYGWLHTDVLTKAWSVAQLIDDCGLAKRITVTLDRLTDRRLALLYQSCNVTIAPGLGEGFGYPIVESLASGVPVVHGDYAGGSELVPRLEWRFPIREVRLDGQYALRRPVYRPEDVANAIERIWAWQEALGPATTAAYCRGAVAHLDWSALWPRWQRWITQGLEGGGS